MTQAATIAPPQGLNRKQRRQAKRNARKTGRSGVGFDGQQGGKTLLLTQAADLHRAGRLEEAAAIYKRVLAADPKEPNALYLLGTICHATGDAQTALTYLEQAVEIVPKWPAPHNNLGVTYAFLGREEDAVRCYETALSLQPNYGDALKNLGYSRQRQGRTAEAVELLKAAIEHLPEDGEAQLVCALSLQTLGRAREAFDHLVEAARLRQDDGQTQAMVALALRERGRPKEALGYAQKALQVCPTLKDAKSLLGVCLLESGRRDEAISVLIEAVNEDPDNGNAQQGLGPALREKAPSHYTPDLERALTICFDKNFVKYQDLTPTAAQLLKLKFAEKAKAQGSVQDAPAAGDGARQVRLDGILTEGLLIRLLHKVLNTDPFLESFLTQIRRALLFSTLQQPQLSPEAYRFMAALACQCHHNSYVFWTEQDETAAVEAQIAEMETLLNDKVEPSPELEARLLLIAMYRPLDRLAGAARLAQVAIERWSEVIRPVLAFSLHNRMREQQIRTQIGSIVAIEDEVSRKVRAQYEENPYPRWWQLPDRPTRSYAELVRIEMPHFEPPAVLDEPIEVLIAGCGTGQHPITVAAYTKNVRLLAVDLSLSSLAYAKRMAEDHGVENITFKQGDILRLSELGRTFPAIECAGVLHHMKQPEAGLEVLIDLLAPDGLLKLGLYSEAARKAVVSARARIAELGLESNPKDMRAFRQRILTGKEDQTMNALVGFRDFFDLDSARDLMFHVQEHRYTIPQLADMLDRHGLEFLGFRFEKPTVKQSYAQRFPEDPEMRDLERWHQFELAEPRTFAGMYEFWCRKRA